MRIIDISILLNDRTVAWPGDRAFERMVHKKIMPDGVECSSLHLSAHNGTHIDAPRHFIEGRIGIDQLDLDILVGPCQVVEIPGTRDLSLKELVAYEITEDRVLFKLGNGPLLKHPGFTDSFRALTEEVAEFLVEGDIKLVGIDYLSVEHGKEGAYPVHEILLAHNTVIIEALDLSEVSAGVYQIVALPLKIENGDGAPARVVLIQE